MNRKLLCLISLITILGLFTGSGGVLAQGPQPPGPFVPPGEASPPRLPDYPQHVAQPLRQLKPIDQADAPSIELGQPGTSFRYAETFVIYLPLVNKSAIVQQPTWKLVGAPTSNDLASVSVLSANSGFAVGKTGTIIKWNGTNWTSDSNPTTNDLSSVSIGDAYNGWAVSGNIILKWDGTNWNQVAGAPNLPFQAVDAVADKAWMVGGYLVCSPACDDLTSFISYWNGSSWSTSYNSHKYLYSVDMISTTDGFAVGDIYDPANPLPAIIRWNGSTWDNQTHPAVRGLYDISVFDSNNAWAVGADTNMDCTLLRLNGTTWTAYTCPIGVSGLSSISMVSANDVWAVGGDDIIHWDGSSWSRVAVSVPANLYDIDMLSAIEGWAVGANGTIMHFSP